MNTRRGFYALGLLVFPLLYCEPLFAAAVFGPRTYVRGTGAPNEFSEIFNLRGSASQFDVIIHNGNPNGSQRITAGWVWLNGIQILGPEDFDERDERRNQRTERSRRGEEADEGDMSLTSDNG
jgi:hypothetical protein